MYVAERKKLNRVKKAWLKGMRAAYPNFEAKKWGRPSYRFKHPQP
jgi:hypothetical protein